MKIVCQYSLFLILVTGIIFLFSLLHCHLLYLLFSPILSPISFIFSPTLSSISLIFLAVMTAILIRIFSVVLITVSAV